MSIRSTMVKLHSSCFKYDPKFMLGHILLSIHPRENLELKLLELESTKYMFCLS